MHYIIEMGYFWENGEVSVNSFNSKVSRRFLKIEKLNQKYTYTMFHNTM